MKCIKNTCRQSAEINSNYCKAHSPYVDDKGKIIIPGPPNSPQQNVNPSHYHMAIEPIEFIMKNKLSYCEGNVIKYICRWRNKGKTEDLRKAIQYIEFLIEEES